MLVHIYCHIWDGACILTALGRYVLKVEQLYSLMYSTLILLASGFQCKDVSENVKQKIWNLHALEMLGCCWKTIQECKLSSIFFPVYLLGWWEQTKRYFSVLVSESFGCRRAFFFLLFLLVDILFSLVYHIIFPIAAIKL